MALSLLEDLKPVRPCDPNLLFLEARVYEIVGEVDRAIALYKVIIKLFPQLPEPYNNLAAVYATRGEIDKAESLLLMGLETHNAYHQLQRNLSMVYIARAADAYKKALSIEDSNESIAAAPSTLQLLDSKSLFHPVIEKFLQPSSGCDEAGEPM
uniref:FOG: TPR repeat n=1 Tax=uncultured gamma proteobacterium HF0200_24F15 TaxID=723570 RepID=E7C3Z0_9GAMM|nr:FOG: TPR repeat [uncultured gamma proteobacterium HF0200_24F15]